MALPTMVRRGADSHEMTQRDFDTLLGRLFGGRIFEGGDILAPYAVDVREDAEHIFVEAELPGFRKDDVDINIENQTLTITAEHKESKDENPPKRANGSCTKGATRASSAGSRFRPRSIRKASSPSSMTASSPSRSTSAKRASPDALRCRKRNAR